MKIAIFGNKQLTYWFFQGILENSLCSPKEICLVTLSPEGIQKYNIAGVSKNLEEAFALAGSEVLSVDDYDLNQPGEGLIRFLTGVDIGFSIGWQRIIPELLLSKFKVGLFGWHASPFRLPNGSGRSPLNWAIRLGFEETWLNCFRYSEFVDRGPIFHRSRVDIAKTEYIGDVISKILELQIADAARLIEVGDEVGSLLTPQPTTQAIWFPKLSDADGELTSISMHVEEALNIVRATSHPFPGAWARVGDSGSIVRVWSAAVANRERERGSACRDVEVVDGKLWVKLIDGFLVSDHFDIVA